MTKSNEKYINHIQEAEHQKAERERRRKLRLIQVRQQEKRIASQLRKKFQERRDNEIELITKHIQAKYQKEQDVKLHIIKRTYQNSLSNVGHGHNMATQVVTAEPKQVSSDAKARALIRHKKALQQIQEIKTSTAEEESRRSEAKKGIVEKQRQLADSMKKIEPATSELILGYASTRYHLPERYIERETFNPDQENAMRAAELESTRMELLKKEKEKARHEYNEKARLRYHSARTKVLLQQDYDDLISELQEYDLLDRQRRQNAVSNLPVNIFQPLNHKIEDDADKQAKLEEQFEDLFSADIDLGDDRLLSKFKSDSSISENLDKEHVENDLQQNDNSGCSRQDSEDTQEINENEMCDLKENTEMDQTDPMKKLLEKIRLQRESLSSIDSKTYNYRANLRFDFNFNNFELTIAKNISRNTDPENENTHSSPVYPSKPKTEITEETERLNEIKRDAAVITGSADDAEEGIEESTEDDKTESDYKIKIDRLSMQDKKPESGTLTIEKQEQAQEDLQKKLLEIQSRNLALEQQQRQLQKDIEEQQQLWARQKLLQEQERDSEIISGLRQITQDESDSLQQQRFHAREKLLETNKPDSQVETDIKEDQRQWAQQKLLEQKKNSDVDDIGGAIISSVTDTTCNDIERENSSLVITSDKVKQYQESILNSSVTNGRYKILGSDRIPLNNSVTARSSNIAELEAKLFTEKKELEDLKYQLEHQRLLYNQEKGLRDKNVVADGNLRNDVESKKQTDSSKAWFDEFIVEDAVNEHEPLLDPAVPLANDNISNYYNNVNLSDRNNVNDSDNKIQLQRLGEELNSTYRHEINIKHHNPSSTSQDITSDNYGFMLSPVPEEEEESDLGGHFSLDALDDDSKIKNKEIMIDNLNKLSNDGNLSSPAMQIISAYNANNENGTTLDDNQHQQPQLQELSEKIEDLNADLQLEPEARLSSYTMSSETSPSSESEHASTKHLRENLNTDALTDIQISFGGVFSSYPLNSLDPADTNVSRNAISTNTTKMVEDNQTAEGSTAKVLSNNSKNNYSSDVHTDESSSTLLAKNENLEERPLIIYGDWPGEESEPAKQTQHLEYEHAENNNTEFTTNEVDDADYSIMLNEYNDMQPFRKFLQEKDTPWDATSEPSSHEEGDTNAKEVTLQDAFLRRKKGFVKNSTSRLKGLKKKR
ncbi:uncharacterized protein TRIADDRAFT_52154 [Trichoplax adhaerens]|uniref:Uncharacterized protein n=1 Tax=Trichoplax adhaerens TaxID=10228 RepID=B3RLX3_TRIAD|nr:hypothetical protein TRIADDRAFT_52154 [Trichoplax adhaerens]EDV29599.1 hypothetical protein TRIADDRAFT_52154 [Trichoplax adhaerens]|eukprot:XP_002108801.1 hypothetical protein TRIADDRAFT_52154 [Trichoplax adhaerens]